MTEPEQNGPAGPFRIMDGHVDVVYEMVESHLGTEFDKLENSPITLEKMRLANVGVIVAALYCPDTHNGEKTAAAFLQSLISHSEKYMTGLAHIRSRFDLEGCFNGEGPGMVLLVENADAFLDIDRSVLDRAGIKVAGLTHMGRNRIGDGNMVRFPAGLSDRGKKLVRDLSGAGFAFDAAHLAEPGFRDLARIHEGFLISSHTGVRRLCDIPRNLTMEQIGIIIERKGVVGIAADPNMLSMDAKAGIDDVFRHIDTIAQAYEADCIGIGSDFCGFFSTNDGLEDISKLQGLAELLLARGYPEESVRGIMGLNWYNFYHALL